MTNPTNKEAWEEKGFDAKWEQELYNFYKNEDFTPPFSDMAIFIRSLIKTERQAEREEFIDELQNDIERWKLPFEKNGTHIHGTDHKCLDCRHNQTLSEFFKTLDRKKEKLKGD